MILYYAMGGGLGHQARSLAIIGKSPFLRANARLLASSSLTDMIRPYAGCHMAGFTHVVSACGYNMAALAQVYGATRVHHFYPLERRFYDQALRYRKLVEGRWLSSDVDCSLEATRFIESSLISLFA